MSFNFGDNNQLALGLTSADSSPPTSSSLLLIPDIYCMDYNLTVRDVANGARVGRGHWTEAEHAIFMAGLKMGPKISSNVIAAMVGSRDARQVRTHRQKYFEKKERRRVKASKRSRDMFSQHSVPKKKDFDSFTLFEFSPQETIKINKGFITDPLPEIDWNQMPLHDITPSSNAI